MIKQTNIQELNQWIKEDAVVLIDVREVAEHSASNIKQATLMPLGKVSARLLPPHDNKKLVLHCKSGMRSMKACHKLISENPELELYNLEGGISAWQEAGLPIQKSGKKIMPLDRQVQLTIGILLIISALFIHFINSLFLLIPALIGCGLTFAGLTGNCGLALIIAKMPWNQKE